LQLILPGGITGSHLAAASIRVIIHISYIAVAATGNRMAGVV